MRRFTLKKFLSALLAVLLAACGGPVTETEHTMIAWAGALRAHLATGGNDGDYAFPHNLGQLDSGLTAGLSKDDAWGRKFLYRRIRDDRFQMISAGADGEYGNEDDIVVENGLLYDPVEVYKKRPLRKKKP